MAQAPVGGSIGGVGSRIEIQDFYRSRYHKSAFVGLEWIGIIPRRLAIFVLTQCANNLLDQQPPCSVAGFATIFP